MSAPVRGCVIYCMHGSCAARGNRNDPHDCAHGKRRMAVVGPSVDPGTLRLARFDVDALNRTAGDGVLSTKMPLVRMFGVAQQLFTQVRACAPPSDRARREVFWAFSGVVVGGPRAGQELRNVREPAVRLRLPPTARSVRAWCLRDREGGGELVGEGGWDGVAELCAEW
jgi:hypothetical protein